MEKKVKVKVRPRKNGKTGPFYFNGFGRIYHLVPNKIIEMPEKIVREFGQYFETIHETPDVVKPVEKIEKSETTKTPKIDTQTKPIKKDKEELTYLEMKSKVSEMGINTHGMKKNDLEKILKEN